MRFYRSILIILSACVWAGCATVGPDYKAPETTVPDQWHTQLEGGLLQGTPPAQTLSRWWSVFNDPVLSDLIEQAIDANLDLKQARARIKEARAARGVSRADQFPSLTASASGSRSRGSENTGSGQEGEIYDAGFDAAWELDLFGGIRRSVEAAQADLEASRESLHDTLVSLLAEVARNYVEVRTLQSRLAVAQANLSSQQETYDITRSKFEAGLSSELPLQQALYNLSSTRATIPTLRTSLEAAKNRLAVLVGRCPGQVHAQLAEQRPVPVTPTTAAAGIPADVLRRRPDIRQAERQLAAQTARIGVAVAEKYPRIQLTGTIGLQALATGDLFTAQSRTWQYGPGISWPIFKGGAIRSNIVVQTAKAEQALYTYRATVLSALEEVENNLSAYAEEQIRRTSLIAAKAAAQRAADLARDQYKAGLGDFSSVLEAQRSQLSFEDQLAQSEGAVTTNLISLYKSLGGGWTADDSSQGPAGTSEIR
jgi:multidrug efflux system outer membrane protein